MSRKKDLPQLKHRIIGIDPGLTKTGVVIARAYQGKLEILKHLIIGAGDGTWYQKCDGLAHKIVDWIEENTEPYTVLHIMIEDVYGQRVPGRAWPSAIQNRLLGVMVNSLREMRLRTVIINTIVNTTVKKMFTGYGNAQKCEVVDKAKELYRFKQNYSILNKQTLADAVAITYCGWKYYSGGEMIMKGVNKV